MKENYYFLIFIFTLLYLGCGDAVEAPEQVFYKMKSYACSADKREFYSHVDKGLVEKNFKKSLLQSMNVDTTDVDENDELDPYSVREMTEIVIPNIMILKWELINQQIELGDKGSICNMEVLGKLEDGRVLELQYPDGTRSNWGFQRNSDGYSLISISDESPLEIIGSGWDIDSIVRSQAQNEIGSVKATNRADNQVVDKDLVQKDKIDEPKIRSEKSPANSELLLESSNQNKLTQKHESTASKQKQPSQKVDESNEVSQRESRSDSLKTKRGDEDFGRARWGMNWEQVISAQGSDPIYEQDDILKFNGIYLGMSAQVIYIFSKDRLVKGTYNLYGNKTDESYYFRNYLRIKELLSIKYGPPIADDQIWINSLYKDSPDQHGFALQIGHLIYKTRWSVKRTNVLLELKSGNYGTLLEAYFFSK